MVNAIDGRFCEETPFFLVREPGPFAEGYHPYSGWMQQVSDSLAGGNGETHGMGIGSFAALSLLAANAGMLFLYVALDLTLFQLVFVYWWEALWIGLFSGIKLLTASLFGSPYENRWVGFSRGGSFLMSLFVIVTSGGAYLLVLVLTGVALVVAQQDLSGTEGSDFVREQVGLIFNCSLIFLAGHGLSFIVNFLLQGEFRHARFGSLMWLPFKRSLALFIAIAASLTVIQTYPGTLGNTTYAAILITIKLAWDYRLHRRERLAFSTPGMSAESNP